jgi:virginiamycin B lyase
VLPRIGLRSIALGLVLGALIAGPAAAAPHIDGEFDVSSVDSNTKIAAGPDGNIWLTLAFNAAGKDVAKVTPSGQVTEYELGNFANLWSITAGSDGNLWVAHNGGVTKFSPASPETTVETTTIEEIIGSNAMVTGPDGDLWVATDNNLVRIPPAEPTNFKVFSAPLLSPKDIDVTGSVLAIADFNGERVVTATPVNPPTFTEFKLSVGSQGVAGNPAGQIAVTIPGASPEAIGLLTPPGSVQPTELLGDPFGVTFGSDGAFWIAQFASGAVVQLTTANQITPLSGLPKEGPRQITTGPGDTLWVTAETKEEGAEEKPDKVVRISGVEPPPTGGGPPPPPAAPETRITKGPKKRVVTKRKRAKVKFKFASSSPGVSFECALTKLKKSRKAKARPPKFAGCKSPKVYKLKPGRYRFEVRAVLAGIRDPTAAKRSFRVVHRR